MHHAGHMVSKPWMMPAIFLALGFGVIAWAGAWTKELHDRTAREPDSKASRQEVLDTMRHGIMIALGLFLVGLGLPYFIGLIPQIIPHHDGDEHHEVEPPRSGAPSKRGTLDFPTYY